MKRTLLYIVAVLALVSCQKDPEITLTAVEVSHEVFTPSYNSAIVQCDITCSNSTVDLYVLCSPSADMVNAQEVIMKKQGGSYEATLMGLQDETTYYVRYKVSNKMSSLLAKQTNEFKTLTPSIPEVRLVSITNVLDSSATAEISLITDGGAEVNKYGVCWSTDEMPTKDDAHCESPTLQLSYNLSSLLPNTKYYVRAYAVNKKGIAYSEAKSLLTYALPCVETKDITNIQKTGCQLNGEVTFDGNDANYVEGFCWGTKPHPTLSDNCTTIAETEAIFSHNLTNLTDETTYYVRAFAKNKIGLVYGNEQTFTTQAADKPTITTSSVTKITYTSATCAGNVTDDGGASVTERGVCYSTSANPTTSNSIVKSGSGTGSFTCSLTSLTDGTTYYVRAYAVNKKGTSYGDVKTFTTMAYSTPTVTTDNVTNISYTSATCGGNVTDGGGQNVTERGICYGTTTNPTISNTKVTSGSGTGSFSCNLTGLTDGTTYYVRAYATNNKGTSYGEVKTFTTSTYSAPIITTTSVTNVMPTSAHCGGNVINDGGQMVTERGICYAITSNPTISDTKVVASGASTGTFFCVMNSLTEGTKYYVRAYATNNKGTSYGEIKSFTTKVTSGTEVGHEWVDLGLSVKWATCNVGATSPEGYGNYYAWGETTEKSDYSWATYTLGNSNGLTKYCSDSGFGIVDNKTTLEKCDDAASVNWGGNWRMPTYEEEQELYNNCTMTWTNDYNGTGVAGMILTSKITGYTNKYLFLPVAGYRSGTGKLDVGLHCIHWSSSISLQNPLYGLHKAFDSSGLISDDMTRRFHGFSVRAIYP